MKFLKNNLGISLVESLVAMGLTAAAGVAYMSHMKNVAKNDADQKIRASLDNLAFEATTYLQSRDICSGNFAQAFKNVAIPSSGSIQSQNGFASLLGKISTDASGSTYQPVIFEPKKAYDAYRIYVDNVTYKLSDITATNLVSSPWNRSAKLTISVEFVTCRHGTTAIPQGSLSQLVCPANQQKRVTKRIERLAAFKVGSTGVIETYSVNGVDKQKLACADSQDALVEEAQNYTDLKVCLSEFRMMLMSGKTGTTPCNLKIVPTAANKKTVNYSPSQQGLNLVGNYIFTNSLNFMLVSGAGGGGFGGADGHGGPGGAGKVRKIKGSDITSTDFKNCKIQVGAGGRGVGQGGESNGSPTILMCPGAPNVMIEGGNRGADKISKSSNCGRQGEQLVIDGVSYGSPGGGRCRKSSSGSDGTLGSGGGGGAYGANTSGWRKDGTPGGPGFVVIDYRGFNVEDPDNVLDRLNTNIGEVMSGMSESVIVNN